MSDTPHAPDGSALRIRYENTAEDRLAFGHYLYGQSDAVRRARRKLAWSLPLFIAAIFGALFLVTRDSKYLFAGAVMAPVWALVVPRLFDHIVRRQLRAQLAKGDTRGLIGPRTLELDGDDLVERTDEDETRTRLAAIDRIVTEGGRTFVLLGSSAHVIPHAAVTEGDRQAFVAALEQRRAEARA